MEINKKVLISRVHSKKDYRDLKLALDSHQEIWEDALEIFISRIDGRFFKPINLLIYGDEEIHDNYWTSVDTYSYGFSAMALSCLLIETLYQFKEGLAESLIINSKGQRRGITKDAFIDFLTQSDSLNVHFEKKTAETFYKDIRCGVLHQAQTKGNSKLTCDIDRDLVTIIRAFNPEADRALEAKAQSGELELTEDDLEMIGIMVSVPKFIKHLELELKDYCDKLLHNKDDDLRNKFIFKMSSIVCK